MSRWSDGAGKHPPTPFWRQSRPSVSPIICNFPKQIMLQSLPVNAVIGQLCAHSQMPPHPHLLPIYSWHFPRVNESLTRCLAVEAVWKSSSFSRILHPLLLLFPRPFKTLNVSRQHVLRNRSDLSITQPVEKKKTLVAPSLFSPLSAVCLTSFTYLSRFLCTSSVHFAFLLCCHTLLHRHPPSHALSPPFSHSSVAADVDHVTICLPSLADSSLCLISCHKSLALMLHQHAGLWW